MSHTFKILMNSLFGVMITRVERFKNFKIITTEEEVDKKLRKLILIQEIPLMMI